METFFHTYFALNTETGLVDLSWPVAVILILAGFAVGVINTMAGAGTAITYSLFMLLGLPANVANGTIRFGVIMQTFSSSATFWRHGKLDIKKGLGLSIPVIIGTLLGAGLAVEIDHEVFKKVLGVVLLVMLIFMFYDPQKWIKEQVLKTQKKISLVQYLLFFALGIYGGFIHIGVGIFLISVLVLQAGYDLVKANALKVFLVFLYSPFALAVFIWSNQVNYAFGLIAAIGNVLGGILASRLAIKKGAGFVRWFMVLVILVFATKLFLE